MLRLSCPACGAQVPFASRGSVFAVCAYCKAMIVRTDLNLKSIGKQATLKADASPIRLGTGGVVDRVPFSVIGRVQVSWEDGYWNEWCLNLSDGRTGWLADAQGFYLITFPLETPTEIPSASRLVPGHKLTLAGVDYEVEDSRECRVVASEGELPFTAPHGKAYTSVDLANGEGRAASFSFSDEGVEIYIGRYFEFDELKLTQLRQIDGF